MHFTVTQTSIPSGASSDSQMLQKEEKKSPKTLHCSCQACLAAFRFVGPELPNAQTNDAALPPQTNYYSSFLYIALKTPR